MGILDTIRIQFARIKNFLFRPPTENGAADIPDYSPAMKDNINLWYSMFINRPPWESQRVIPLGLPAAICREFANPTLLEFSASITGSQRADFLQECFSDAQEGFRDALETGLALGGVAFKPYPFNGRLLVDTSSPSAFFPMKFNEARICTSGAFKSKPVRVEKDWYVKIEYHDLNGTTYTIRNRAYKSNSDGGVGSHVDLGVVEEWAGIEPEVQIENVEKPLFAYFRPPIANNIDTSSDIGVSVYSGAAVDLIKQADEQWEMLRWEYYSGRRKIVSDKLSMQDAEGEFDKDLFILGMFSNNGAEFFKEFSPSFRDDAIYRGFQSKLKQIEFQVGLAYGTISDPNTVDKTATEIRNSKQRMYVTVDSIQKALGHTFENLIYAMDVYATLYGLAPKGDYDVSFEWGDSILNDEDTRRIENQDMRADVAANLIRPELYLMKKYKVTEEEALAMMPTLEETVTEEQEEVE